MKQKVTRGIFARLMTLALLVIMLFTTAACQKDEQKTPDDTGTDAVGAETEPSYDPMLEAIDYEGDEFVILQRSNYGGTSYEEFDMEEYTDDSINQSVFDRNAYLEDKYNIDIVVEVESKESLPTTVYNLVQTDMVNFDLVNLDLAGIINLARNGLLIEASNIPVIDTQQPYWFTDIIDACTVDNKSFLLTGDANLWVLHSVGAVMFNKGMVQDTGLESPYDLVTNNQWTYSKLLEMTKAVKNENGDGVWNENDRYGVVSTYAAVETMFNGMGGLLVTKDDQDVMSVEYLSTRNLDIITKIVEYWADTESALLINRWPSYVSPNGASSNMMADVFNSGNALFVIEMMYQLPTLVDSEFGVGIVPAPKYDEIQTDYYSFVHYSHATAVGVPISWKDDSEHMDYIGRVLEDMNFKSKETVRETYYEDNLRRRRAKDEESYDMLEVIYDSLIVDIGGVLGGAGFKAAQTVRSLVYNGDTSSIYSGLFSYYEPDKAILQDLVDNYFKTGSN
ncbi:MAG: hypothetical protein IJW55_03935 [Clostridia bacterium]|nr:hypothetical protein [Clostridia bacterium]